MVSRLVASPVQTRLGALAYFCKFYARLWSYILTRRSCLKHISTYCLCLQYDRAAEDLCIPASLQLTKTSGVSSTLITPVSFVSRMSHSCISCTCRHVRSCAPLPPGNAGQFAVQKLVLGLSAGQITTGLPTGRLSLRRFGPCVKICSDNRLRSIQIGLGAVT